MVDFAEGRYPPARKVIHRLDIVCCRYAEANGNRLTSLLLLSMYGFNSGVYESLGCTTRCVREGRCVLDKVGCWSHRCENEKADDLILVLGYPVSTMRLVRECLEVGLDVDTARSLFNLHGN